MLDPLLPMPRRSGGLSCTGLLFCQLSVTGWLLVSIVVPFAGDVRCGGVAPMKNVFEADVSVTGLPFVRWNVASTYHVYCTPRFKLFAHEEGIAVPPE